VANSDSEQVEALQQWLRENGWALVAGVVIAIGGVIGWQQWGAYQERQLAAAAAAYQQLIDARDAAADAAAISALADTLVARHARSVYAPMAALQAAGAQAEAGDLAAARRALAWVLEPGRDPVLQALARERQALILLDLGEYRAALSLLEGADEVGFAGRHAEIRGDAHRRLGDVAAAVRAYEIALTATDGGISASRRMLIQLKRDDLGGGEP
jgi:predicted negative regulator of RcsB-dependent stress response